jgi:membrane dipeptidase
MSSSAALEQSVSDSGLASRLGVSLEAVQLTRSSDVIDLHLDTFILRRLFAYDPLVRHERGPLGRHLMWHSDLPRLNEGGFTGGMWSITTNPFRSAQGRWAVLQKNIARMRQLVDGSNGRLRFARNVAEYRQAKEAKTHAVFLAVQGGDALSAATKGVSTIADGLLTRVTLVHLLSSVYGATSSPLSPFRREKGLTNEGRELVTWLNAHRIFVDLAHIHPQGFWDAVRVHDRSQPLIATHTGVSGVTPHWRNLDDGQLKAIAETGGTVGIIFSEVFLRRPGGPGDTRMIVEHMDYVRRTIGEDFVSLGSDYDGFISPPADMANVSMLPRLVQRLLEAGWSDVAIRKALGGNVLRAFELLRPSANVTFH